MTLFTIFSDKSLSKLIHILHISAYRSSLSLRWPHLTALQGHCCNGECPGVPGEGIHFGLPQLSAIIVSDASGVVLGRYLDHCKIGNIREPDFRLILGNEE